MTEKHIKGYIKRNSWKELEESGHLSLLILLSRIVNTLRSNFRAYIRIEHDDFILQYKDRIDLMFIHGSMIYEAAIALKENSKQIHQLVIWPEIFKDYQFFTKQLGKNNSFINTILKKIRNKLFFHFDSEELLSSLKLFDEERDIHFITSKSEKNHDVIYSFNDDLALSYLANLDGEGPPGYEKLEKIQTEIIDLSHKLTVLCEKIIKSLLHGKVYKTKSIL